MVRAIVLLALLWTWVPLARAPGAPTQVEFSTTFTRFSGGGTLTMIPAKRIVDCVDVGYKTLACGNVTYQVFFDPEDKPHEDSVIKFRR